MRALRTTKKKRENENRSQASARLFCSLSCPQPTRINQRSATTRVRRDKDKGHGGEGAGELGLLLFFLGPVARRSERASGTFFTDSSSSPSAPLCSPSSLSHFTGDAALPRGLPVGEENGREKAGQPRQKGTTQVEP